MPRVLFTASTFSHIVSFHRPYLRAFRALGWQVDVACGGAPAEVPEADRCFALPFEKKMTSPRNLRAQQQLRRLLRENAYTLVCTHTALAAFFTRRAAAPLHPRPPIVCVAHGYLFDDATPLPRRSILLAAEKLTAPQTDLLLTMNRSDLALAQRHRLAARIDFIPGVGVDFSPFTAPCDRAAVRAQYAFAPEDFVLLYAAEFSARKNQKLLLLALTALPQRVKLLLPGQGALLEECRSLAARLGVLDRVRFPGFVRPAAPLYAAADAAVSASRSEGLPFNIMEAMAARLPIVASAVKGHTDLITDGETGLLYPYNNAAAFARCVRRLLDDPALCEGLGAAAQTASQPYALDRVLPQLMAHYQSLT